MSMIFCRGCGKEIHESAPTCPHCGAPQHVASSQGSASLSNQGKVAFSSYDQVPWFRKRWFAVVCVLIFTPGLLVILLTGDVYYEKKGQLEIFSKGRKIFLIVWAILTIVFALLR